MIYAVPETGQRIECAMPWLEKSRLQTQGWLKQLKEYPRRDMDDLNMARDTNTIRRYKSDLLAMLSYKGNPFVEMQLKRISTGIMRNIVWC